MLIRVRLMTVVFALAIGAFAQQPASTAQRKTETAASARDLSGVWFARGLSADIFAKDDAAMTPWAEEKYKEAKPSFGPRSVLLAQTNDPVYKCFPPGVPRVYFHPMPVQIVQIPGQTIMLFEYDHTVRHIFTDGRAHPEDLDLSWMGHSIGKWEGDTFVVDTIGFHAQSWIDRLGHAHSDQLHTVERMRRTDPDALRIDITLEDPKAFTRPLTATINFQLRPKWDIVEQNCTDNVNFEEFESAGQPAKK